MKTLNRAPKNVLYFILSTFLFSCHITSGFAASSCTPSNNNTRLIYVNGVGNPSPDDADTGAFSLGTALSTPGHLVNVESFWSPSDGIFADGLAAVALQRYGGPVLDFISGMINTSAEAEGRGLVDLRTTFLSTQRPYIDELKFKLRDGISKGQKFVLIPHSRGNLLVDTAVAELRAEYLMNNNPAISSIGVVNIASPNTQKTPDLSPDYSAHVTRSDDRIISNPLVVGHLPDNFTPVTTTGSSSLRHLIDEDYLNPTVVDAKGVSIRNTVTSSINAVRDAVESCGLQLVLVPSSGTIQIGIPFRLSVVPQNVGRDFKNAPAPLITWTSSSTDTAEIVNTSGEGGVATADIIGKSVSPVTITATDQVTGKNYISNLNVVNSVIKGCNVTFSSRDPYTGTPGVITNVLYQIVVPKSETCRGGIYGAASAGSITKYEINSPPSHGIATTIINGDRYDYLYTPDPGYTGPDFFSIKDVFISYSLETITKIYVTVQ